MQTKTPKINYYLSMSAPQTHYFEVKIKITHLEAHQPYVDFKMPVWTPGSYLIREFPRNVEAFQAFGKNKTPLTFRKMSKNTWRVGCAVTTTVEVNYRVYAYELTVRTSFLDASHAVINGASVFMYIDHCLHQEATLSIKPYKDWEEIATPLQATKNRFTFHIPDFDTLVDSPIEIGKHRSFEFKLDQIPHRVAIYGLDEYPQKQLTRDMRAIARSARNIFREHPCKAYTFIVHFISKGTGGLEHKDATTLAFSKSAFQTEEGYHRFLTLVAHEYFHLWNVKRLRPAPLGPFDYNQENYTTLLWVAEGFTSYYQELILLKAGLLKPKDFLQKQTENIQYVESRPGAQIQSLADASMDAWIKAYRPNENSANSTVSYYTKGAVVALLLDLEIIQNTQGEKCLDDVMRLLYKRYYQQADRGFTEEEIQQTLEEVANKRLDQFFEKYIYGTAKIAYAPFLEYAGIIIEEENEEPLAYLGIQLDNDYIRTVWRDSPADKAGLNVRDKLLGINYQTIKDIEQWLFQQSPGKTVTFHIEREGYLTDIDVKLSKNPWLHYELQKMPEMSETQKKVYKKWMRR